VSAPEPLSEQRRAEIERYRESARGSAAVTGVIYRMHVGGLLAEVDRLRAITERGAATIEAARRLVDVHEQRGGINGVLAARKNLSAALAALADPVRLPEPEPCCDGDEAITSESEYGPAEYIGFVHAEDCTASLFPEPEATRSLLDAALRGIPVTDPPAELLTIDAVMEAIDGLWEIDEDHLEHPGRVLPRTDRADGRLRSRVVRDRGAP
jgi:hypothetical protein